MKRILFVTTQYRVGERIYPIIPNLAKKYKLDLMKLYQMNPSWAWPGDGDLRKYFDKEYLHHFNNVYTDINIDYSKYDLIITDDNRQYNGLQDIYFRRKCLVLACNHGVSEHGYETHGFNISFDGCFVFGNKEAVTTYHIPAGIPSNDKLERYKGIDKQHILVIINYLGNAGKQTYRKSDLLRSESYFKLFGSEVFNSIDLLSLQKKYNKPVVIKMKSRPGTDISKDTDYLASVLSKDLDYTVLYDVEDDNKMIAESEIVISAPSTLALKPIQLGIPTALILGTGQTGIFYDYDGLVQANKKDIINALSKKPNMDFINNTLAGGSTFNSTEYFINYIGQCIDGK